MYIQVTQETLELVKTAMKNPMVADDLIKAFTQSTGLVYYDLQAPALRLYPVITPLRNKIPRVGAAGGTATNWKAITGVDAARIGSGIAEGRRGGLIATTVAEYTASYKGLGLEDSVSIEAEYAGRSFEDVRAVAVEGLLRALMKAEEQVIWGGNNSVPLGTTPTPTVSASDTGGALSAGTWSVVCVALTPDGYWRAGVAGGIPGRIDRVNADGSTTSYGGGSAEMSAAATGVVGAGATGGKLAVMVKPVIGAAAYAWFWGSAGQEVLGAITTVNSVVVTAVAAGTQKPSDVAASDNSTDGYIFDGLLAQVCSPGSGAYIAVQPTGTAGTGAPLTSDGAGGIVEIDTAFESFWANYRLSPQEMYVSSQELTAINNKVISGGGAPLYRFQIDAANPGVVRAGVTVGSYLNKITNQEVRIVLHPNAVPGTILFYSDSVPYPLSGVQNLVQMKLRRDYYQIEWPLHTRQYEYGVYCDGVLQNFFPPAFGIITNIGRG